MGLSTQEIRLKGIPLSPGVARGIACTLFTAPAETVPPTEQLSTSVEEELKRLQDALDWLTKRLINLAQRADARLGKESAAIFLSHLMILEDPILKSSIITTITEEQLRADHAVHRHLEAYQQELLHSGHPHLQERATDISELQRSLVARIRRGKAIRSCRHTRQCEVGICLYGNDHILLTEELTPGLTMELDESTRGFLVERGGPTSHAAILARALGLPAVGGLQNLKLEVPLSATILVDGDSGEVVINPKESTILAYQNRLPKTRKRIAHTQPVHDLSVMANIDDYHGVHTALEAGAEGIGLYRTELEVLHEGHLLTEADQERRYVSVLKAMHPRPVYIRLLDIGADKVAEWLHLPKEDNPALGLRGARLLLQRPGLLRDQVRALARASRQGPIHVIYPMIIDVAQFEELKALTLSMISDIGDVQLFHGAMLEVPSACMVPTALFEAIDFGSIGSNDLIQYLFAADRNSERVLDSTYSEHPALWHLLQTLAQVSQATKTPLSLCGELASDPKYVQRLHAMGIHRLSTSPMTIAAVRDAFRQDIPLQTPRP